MDLSQVRRGATWMMTALAVALTGCGDNGTGPNGDGDGDGNGGGGPVVTTSVTVVDNDFQPGAIRVSPGATVTWTWSGTSFNHNVTFSNPAITNSATQTSGTFATAMPTTPGTYNYVCTIHQGIGMTGSVTVQ